MSLEILLEAAKYLEFSAEVEARDEPPPEVTHFSKRKSHHSSGKSSSSSSSHRSNNKINHSDHSRDSTRSSHSHQDYYGQNYPHQDDSRDKRRTGGAGTREVHNKLEKNRRAHLKECFDMLKRQLPAMDERKTSNLSILRGALRYIQVLKRKEREYEHEMEKLAREKIASQQKLASLKKGLSSQVDHIDVSRYLPDQDNETTTTASECGALSDPEDDPIGPVRQIARVDRLAVQSLRNRPSLARPPSPDTASQSSSTSSASSDGSPIIVVDKTQHDASSSSSVTAHKSHGKHVSTEPSADVAHRNPPKSVVNSKEMITNTVSSSQAKSLPYHSNAAISATHIHFAGAATPSGPTSSGNLQLGNVAGVLAAPHAVQVINQGSGVKVIAATPATLGSGSALFSAPNGPLRILSPTAASSIVAVANPSTTLAMVTPTTVAKIGQQSLVRFSTRNNNAATSESTVVAPVTLVTSSAMVNVNQLNNGKSVVFNQGLPSDQAGRVVATNVGKSAATVTLTNPKGQQYATVASNGLAYVQPKMASHILQAVSQKALSQTLVNAGVGSSLNNFGRHLMTTAIKPGANAVNAIRTPLTQLSRVTQVTQLVTQPTIGQIVTSGNHVLGTPITMVPASAVNHQLNKVLTNAPILKTVNSVPILQQQLQLQTSATVAAPTSGSSPGVGTIKPMMVVSVPSVAASSKQPGVVSLKQ